MSLPWKKIGLTICVFIVLSILTVALVFAAHAAGSINATETLCQRPDGSLSSGGKCEPSQDGNKIRLHRERAAEVKATIIPASTQKPSQLFDAETTSYFPPDFQAQNLMAYNGFANDEPSRFMMKPISELLKIETTTATPIEQTTLRKILSQPHPKRVAKQLFPCPIGGDLFFFCSEPLTILSNFKKLNCSSSPISFANFNKWGCCPQEFEFLKENCNEIYQSPEKMIGFLNSVDHWNYYLKNEKLRIESQGEFLKALQLLATHLKMNMEFSVFTLDFEKDRVAKDSQEHRRFLYDGTLLCYYYNHRSNSGRAKVSPCPNEIKDTKLDLENPKLYRKPHEGSNVGFLTLPTWEEYQKL